MQIGDLPLPNNFFLAPMAGISDYSYRRLMKRFGAGLVFTEMISAEGLVRYGSRTRQLLRSSPEESPLAVQLFGTDPEVIGRATAAVEADGALVDINMGCPVPKVVRSGAGSALMRDARRAGRVVAAARRATGRPLTVKIRSGWDAASVNFLEIARVAVSEGADAVTLHPRTRAQGFAGQADWEQIRRLKEILPVPVIGSGDILTADDALRMLDSTGCDAVMIGRGGYGNPWIFSALLSRVKGNPFSPPSAADRKNIALLHLEMVLEERRPDRAVREMRKHLAWYARGLPGATHFRAEINRLQSVAEVRRSVEEFFGAAEDVNAAQNE